MDEKPSVVRIDDGKDGMTELERLAMSGELDSAKYKSLAGDDMSQEVAEQLQQAAALQNQQLEEYLEKLSQLKPSLPAPTTIDQLDLEERDRVIQNLATITDKFAQNSETPEPAPEPTIPALDEVRDFRKEVAKPAAPEPEEAEEVSEVVTCNNCGWKQDEDITKPTDEDIENWTRTILGHARFEKTYPLMNGQLEVTFRSRTKKEQDAISEQLIAEVKDERIPTFPQFMAWEHHLGRSRQLQLAASFVHITGFSTPLDPVLDAESKKYYQHEMKTDPVVNEIAAAHEVIFSNWSDQLYAAVFKQAIIFDALCLRLTEAMSSPNFWKGIAGAS